MIDRPVHPKSLLWRLGALALAVTAVSFVLHFSVITMLIRPLGDRMVSNFAAQVELTRALLEATPSSQRSALADRPQRDLRLQRGEAPLVDGKPLMTPPLGPILAEQLGSAFRVAESQAGAFPFLAHVVWVSFMVDGEPWHVRIETQPPVAALLGSSLGWLFLAAVAVAASLLIGLRFIVEPIRQIADRIAGQRASVQALVAPVGASTEVLSLVETFNRLAERVQAADRTKQHLLAGVSHDLRTPLTRLRLRIETQCDPLVAEAADGELRAVERIVSQFLAFVQGEGRSQFGSLESVTRTLAQIVASYAEHGVALQLEADASDVAASALDMQRLLTNLIDNALAHGHGPVVIGWRTKANAEHQLSVWDHGAGLTESEFDAAVEPFVKLNNAAGIGHCGLGLAIVARIAQQWRGHLSCERDAEGRFGVIVSWPAG